MIDIHETPEIFLISSSNANDDNHVKAVAIQFWAFLLGLDPENF
jgi:hypothetical protein